MTVRETRAFALDEVKIETRADGKGKKIIGHAAVFNAWSEDLGGFREMIAPGAFVEAIARDDVRALFNHDVNQVLGRNKSGTLALSEDDKGLRMEIDMPDTQLGRDLLVLVERGDVSQASFAFAIEKSGQEWTKKGEGMWERIVRKVARLYDVSPVTFPAYPQTDAAARCMKELEEAARLEARRQGGAVDWRDVIQGARAALLEKGL